MDLDDYADVPWLCECGRFGARADVRSVQFRVDGKAGCFSNRFKNLCKRCRKKPQYRGHFRLTG